MTRFALPVLLLALVALPASGWTQWGGDAAQSGRTDLGELDVVASYDLAPEGVQLLTDGGPGLVTTATGLVALGRSGASCTLLTGAPGATLEPASGPIPCPLGGRLAAWDPMAQRALLCLEGASTDLLLQAWPLGANEPAWTRAPAVAPDPLSLTGQATGAWSCRGLALDGATLYVPFSSTIGRNRIEALAVADGALLWGASVPADTFVQDTPAGPPPALPDPLAGLVAESSGAFRMEAVAVTRTGILVTGRLDGNGLTQPPPGLAWFDRAGTLQGTYTLATPAFDTSPEQATLNPASLRPAASGNLAASLVGDGLFVVDPANPQGRLTPIAGAVLSRDQVPGPCWGDDWLFVPGESLGFILPGNDLGTVARWPGYGLGRVQECVVSGDTLWTTVTRLDNGTRTDLLAVSLAASASILRLPLPLAPADVTALTIRLTPLDGQKLLAWETGGQAVLLGPAPTFNLPTLEASTLYPAAQQAVVLDLQLPDEAPDGTRLLLAWGDGTLQDIVPGEASRSYVTGGDTPVRLTAVAPDGRTATTSLVLHVGQSAPRARSLLETLFAAENQNYTFFAIGVLTTVVGAVLTAVGVSKGRKRIDRRLRELDAIQDSGRGDPFAAVRRLHDYRLERRRDLAHGHLSDAQYTVLERHADLVLQLLRSRILGGFVGRVSERFSHALDTALADGSFDDAEARELEALVKDETALTEPERRRLRDLVQSWNRVL
ncbi:MAG: hypothetical protein AABX89_05635 [Candidatus Thermoplasmatota archaeon]